MSQLFVIITAPHAFCYHWISERHCDRKAKIAALNFYNKIPYQKEIFLADQPRGMYDFNRLTSRFTLFRQKIRQYLNRLLPFKDSVMVIDIHSFVEHSDDSGYKGEIALLDEIPGTSEYVDSIQQYLINNGVNVTRYVGDFNDIVQESRSYGFKAILIEYNENLSIDRINEINDLLVEWLDLI